MPPGLDVICTGLLFTFLVTGVVCSCNESSNKTSEIPVARMCQNSNVTGTHVYIDDDDAGSTTLSSGVPCTCTVTTQVGKKMEVKLNFNGTLNQTCGTTIEFTGVGPKNGTESHSCNDTTFNVTTHTNRNMNLELRKTQAPYLSTYCVSLTLHYCGENEFQCNSGECIPSNYMCNGDVDCPDGSDKNYCAYGNVLCTEGQIPCPSGKGCMGSRGRCNNVTDCFDTSDEVNCTSVDEQSTPLIKVVCTESKFVAQTTTAPLSTTTSPTTTTPTATTATSTTTTSSPTTITEITETSVASPDQTLLVIFAVVVCICVSALVALCACSKKIEDNKIEREKRQLKRDKFGRLVHVSK